MAVAGGAMDHKQKQMQRQRQLRQALTSWFLEPNGVLHMLQTQSLFVTGAGGMSFCVPFFDFLAFGWPPWPLVFPWRLASPPWPLVLPWSSA